MATRNPARCNVAQGNQYNSELVGVGPRALALPAKGSKLKYYLSTQQSPPYYPFPFLSMLLSLSFLSLTFFLSNYWVFFYHFTAWLFFFSCLLSFLFVPLSLIFCFFFPSTLSFPLFWYLLLLSLFVELLWFLLWHFLCSSSLILNSFSFSVFYTLSFYFSPSFSFLFLLLRCRPSHLPSFYSSGI